MQSVNRARRQATGPGGAGVTALSCWKSRGPYFIAPKRLSNEFDDTIGADPAT